MLEALNILKIWLDHTFICIHGAKDGNDLFNKTTQEKTIPIVCFDDIKRHPSPSTVKNAQWLVESLQYTLASYVTSQVCELWQTLRQGGGLAAVWIYRMEGDRFQRLVQFRD